MVSCLRYFQLQFYFGSPSMLTLSQRNYEAPYYSGLSCSVLLLFIGQTNWFPLSCAPKQDNPLKEYIWCNVARLDTLFLRRCASVWKLWFSNTCSKCKLVPVHAVKAFGRLDCSTAFHGRQWSPSFAGPFFPQRKSSLCWVGTGADRTPRRTEICFVSTEIEPDSSAILPLS